MLLYYFSVWQHVDCINLNRNNIPDEFLCEWCQLRRVDRARARAIRKRQEFRLTTPLLHQVARSSLDRASATRRERSKDRIKPDEYIDMEKTAKGGNNATDRNAKFQRTGKRVG